MAAPDVVPQKVDVSRTVTAALPIALVLPLLAVVAALAKWSPRYSIATGFMVLAAMLLAGFIGLTRRRLPRAGVLAAIHALSWIPLISLLAAQALDETIVSGPLNGHGLRCGTGIMGLAVLVAPLGVVAMLVSSIVLGLAFARRSTDAMLRHGAFAGVALALIAFGFALPRAGWPEADTYLATLAPAGTLVPGTDLVVGRSTLRARRVTLSHRTDPSDPENPAVESHDECQLSGLSETRVMYTADGQCPAMRVSVDPRSDLAVLESQMPTPIDPVGTWWPSFAFHTKDGTVTAITAKTIAVRTAAPVGWTVGAGLGGGLGLVLFLVGRRTRRSASRISGVEAEHLGLGQVRLPGGELLTLDAAAPLLVGPVVLTDRTERAPGYRVTGVPTFGGALAGKLEDLRAARRDLAASLHAVALAVAVLGATPLFVARIMG